jgi:hypothetical protein
MRYLIVKKADRRLNHVSVSQTVRCDRHALPHQKSSTAACSIGGQELQVGFAADQTGGVDGP